MLHTSRMKSNIIHKKVQIFYISQKSTLKDLRFLIQFTTLTIHSETN